MMRHIKNTFIPHEGNDHQPLLLSEAGIAVLALIIVLLFGFSVFHTVALRSSDSFLAAVLPSILIDLANGDRVDQGLSPLHYSPTLEEAARLKAQNMAENGYFAHNSPDGLSPWYWFYRAGYQFSHAGENLAVNFVDSGDVERAWMESPGHRANILNGDFTEIGIATAPGYYKGYKTVFVVQLFGKPLALAPVVEAAGPVAVESVIPEVIVPDEGAQAVAPAELRALEVADADTVAADAPEKPVRMATYAEELVSQPNLILRWGYIILGLLIALTLLLMVWKDIHRKHSRSVLYGFLLLVLIGALLYLNFTLFSTQGLIH